MRIGNFGAILLGAVFLCISVFIFLMMAGWLGPVQTLLQSINNHLLYSGLAAVASLLLAILAFSAVRFGDSEPVAVSSSTPFGQLKISGRTIEEIASRSGLAIDGVKELKPKVFPQPEGMNIHVKTIINPEVVIPEVVKNMQERIKTDVEKYTGLKVTEVKVMVQSVEAGAIRKR